jgi:hypothetical protein
MSPIFPGITCKLHCTQQRWKYVQNKMKTSYNTKLMPSAKVPGQFLRICTIIHPPKFSLDAAFKFTSGLKKKLYVHIFFTYIMSAHGQLVSKRFLLQKCSFCGDFKFTPDPTSLYFINTYRNKEH